MPAVLPSLADVPREGLSAVLAPEAPSRPRLREWLARVPDPRGPRGRWHPLEFVLALAVCAFTAAGHDSPSAIADWATGCGQEDLHYVRDVTFREDAQKARTGNMPANLAALRNLAIGAFRKAGFANTAHARRHYVCDDQRILALYGYA